MVIFLKNWPKFDFFSKSAYVIYAGCCAIYFYHKDGLWYPLILMWIRKNCREKNKIPSWKFYPLYIKIKLGTKQISSFWHQIWVHISLLIMSLFLAVLTPSFHWHLSQWHNFCHLSVYLISHFSFPFLCFYFLAFLGQCTHIINLAGWVYFSCLLWSPNVKSHAIYLSDTETTYTIFPRTI